MQGLLPFSVYKNSSPSSIAKGSLFIKSSAAIIAPAKPFATFCSIKVIFALPLIAFTLSSSSVLPSSVSLFTNSKLSAKWFFITSASLPTIIPISSMPEFNNSSTISWITGLFNTVSIGFGIAFVIGKNLVPNPAAGIIAFLTFISFSPKIKILFWKSLFYFSYFVNSYLVSSTYKLCV